jgi:hypothetical protein
MSNWNQNKTEKAIKKLQNPFIFWAFKISKLPAAWFMGLKIDSLGIDKCIIGIRYSWFNKNPYQSMYFAAQCAAGELATGALAIGLIEGYDGKMLMLVKNIEAEFSKKAVGKIQFTCTQGDEMKSCFEEAISSDKSQVFKAIAVGTDASGEVVSRVNVYWSFKAKK